MGINYLNEKKIPTLCLVHGNELLTKDHKRSQRVIQTLEKVSTIVANSQFTVNLVKDLIPNKGKIKICLSRSH